MAEDCCDTSGNSIRSCTLDYVAHLSIYSPGDNLRAHAQITYFQAKNVHQVCIVQDQFKSWKLLWTPRHAWDPLG